jgi:hypothetical protein
VPSASISLKRRLQITSRSFSSNNANPSLMLSIASRRRASARAALRVASTSAVTSVPVPR